MGSPVHPVSLVVFARDEIALSDAVLASDWTAAQLPTPGLVFDAIFAAVGGSEDPTVETVSHFWRGQPNNLAFVQRAPGATSSLADPKLRFWRTEFVTADGLRAFVGTVGVDEAGETETTQPIGASPMLRDTLVQGLVARGATVLAASLTSDNVVSIVLP